MKRLIALAAVCGVFGFTAVAGATPGAPNASSQGQASGNTACAPILAHNPAIYLDPTPLGIEIFQGVGETFGCFG